MRSDIQEITEELKSLIEGGLGALGSRAYSHNFMLNVLNGCERLTKDLERELFLEKRRLIDETDAK